MKYRTLLKIYPHDSEEVQKLLVNETEILFFSEGYLEIFKNIKPANQVRYF